MTFPQLNRTLFLYISLILLSLIGIHTLYTFIQPVLPFLPSSFTESSFLPGDPDNRHLTYEQCLDRFPRLYYEADRAKRYYRGLGGIKESDVDAAEKDGNNAHARLVIFDNKLFIKSYRNGINTRAQAAVAAIYATVLTSVEPLPNVDFIIHVDDAGGGQHPHFALCRAEEHEAIWLMPDFGFFSWPEPGVGAYTKVRSDTLAYEKRRGNDIPENWFSKIPKLMWRGAPMVEVRQDLFRAAQGQPWSDIKEIDWGKVNTDDPIEKESRGDLKNITEHCAYAFLAHTEGWSYSGRLKYIQQCYSVIVTHPLRWIQHYHHLFDSRPESPERNIVEVQLPLVDHLPAVMEHLLDPINAKEVQRIANNSWNDLRERYISPAANDCYFRYALKAYADVQEFEPILDRATPYEDFLLMGQLHWDPHR